MVSAFDQAFEDTAAPLHDNWFGTSVQIKRGSDSSDAFTAVWSAQEYQTIDHETGLAIAVKRRVYRFLKTDAVVGGSTITPRPGDLIIDGSDSMRILAIDDKPAVEDEPGGYRWMVRTDKLA